MALKKHQPGAQQVINMNCHIKNTYHSDYSFWASHANPHTMQTLMVYGHIMHVA